MTRNDLAELLSVAKSLDCRDRVDLKGLALKPKRAFGVDAREVAADIITMNSRAELFDLDSGEKVTFTVVFPRDADVEVGRISVLAPLGAAMLGYRVGDEFEWKVPYGLRRFSYQDSLSTGGSWGLSKIVYSAADMQREIKLNASELHTLT